MRLAEMVVIGHDAQVRREGHSGQVALVRARVGQALGAVDGVGPQADRALRIGQEDGESGSPGACADDSDLVGHVAEDSSGPPGTGGSPHGCAHAGSGRPNR